MHSLRDTFASHAIVELPLDVVQVSRLLGHANPAITAKTYARMFDEARHADVIRVAMEQSSLGTALDRAAVPSGKITAFAARAVIRSGYGNHVKPSFVE